MILVFYELQINCNTAKSTVISVIETCYVFIASCEPSLVLIAQAVFLLERRNTHRPTHGRIKVGAINAAASGPFLKQVRVRTDKNFLEA